MKGKKKARGGIKESSQNLEEGPRIAQVKSALILPSFGAKRNGKRKERLTELSSRPLHSNLIYSIDNFLSPEECLAWISFAEGTGFIDVQHEESSEIAYRDNGRIEVQDDATASRIWARLSPFVPSTLHEYGVAVGCHGKIRLYRYLEGQRFGKHIDESCDVGVVRRSTGMTVLIYLNDEDLAGGETVFYADYQGTRQVASFAPKCGSLLFHGHGTRCLTHEAAAVRRGVKYVLRTDVVYEQ